MVNLIAILVAVWFATAFVFGTTLGRFIEAGAGAQSRQHAVAKLRTSTAGWGHTTRPIV